MSRFNLFRCSVIFKRHSFSQMLKVPGVSLNFTPSSPNSCCLLSILNANERCQKRYSSTKPYFITTPIFYVNAGKLCNLTSTEIRCWCFSFSHKLLLLLLLFEIRNRIVPTGSTPEGGPTEVSPTTQATRHPRALLLFMFPIPPYLLSCILHPVSPLPRPPVLYRYPTKYLVCPLPVFLSYKTPHI